MKILIIDDNKPFAWALKRALLYAKCLFELKYEKDIKGVALEGINEVYDKDDSPLIVKGLGGFLCFIS